MTEDAKGFPRCRLDPAHGTDAAEKLSGRKRKQAISEVGGDQSSGTRTHRKRCSVLVGYISPSRLKKEGRLEEREKEPPHTGGRVKKNEKAGPLSRPGMREGEWRKWEYGGRESFTSGQEGGRSLSLSVEGSGPS